MQYKNRGPPKRSTGMLQTGIYIRFCKYTIRCSSLCILRLLLVRCMPTAIVQNLWIVRCNQSVQRTRISALRFPQQ